MSVMSVRLKVVLKVFKGSRRGREVSYRVTYRITYTRPLVKGENNKLYKTLLREMGTEEWVFWRMEVISHLERGILPVEKQGHRFD